MTINKYALYLVVVLVAFVVFILPKLIQLQSYKHTEGMVVGFDHRHVNNIRSIPGESTRDLPIVRFTIDRDTFFFQAPDYMKEMVNDGSRVLVVYDPEQPRKAFIENFYGFWGNTFVYLLPCFLIFTISIFHVDMIPKRIKLFGKPDNEPPVY